MSVPRAFYSSSINAGIEPTRSRETIHLSTDGNSPVRALTVLNRVGVRTSLPGALELRAVDPIIGASGRHPSNCRDELPWPRGARL